MGVIENRIDITDLERSGGGTAAHVAYDNTDSGLTATTVQGAIDEVAGDLAELTAVDVAYVNTTSGLTATDVQSAIDEVTGDLALVNTSVASTRAMLAPTEEGPTASAAYEVGDQLIYNNILYKVTDAIAIGDTITPGTNVTSSDNITKQLKDTNDDITGATFLMSDLTETISDFENTDTLPELYAKILTAVNGIISNLDTGESIEIQAVDITGIGTLEVKNKRLVNSEMSIIYLYSFVAGSTQIVSYAINVSATAARGGWSRIAYDGGTVTAGSYSNSDTLSTLNITGASVRYRKYKTV